jgi:RNA polymerase sigma factor (TIGR02999 family)
MRSGWQQQRVARAGCRLGAFRRKMDCRVALVPLLMEIQPRRDVCRITMSDVTAILSSIEEGDSKRAEELLPLVYRELRRLAASKMARQPAGHTLQATALVHEAYIRLAGSGKHSWESRGHFFAAAAEAMRHILVDRARRKKRVKHGGDLQRVDLGEVEVPGAEEEENFLMVHEALNELARVDPVKAEVVKLHYFAGLTHEEVAQVLKVSEKTVRRHWNFARVWLYRNIRGHLGELCLRA